MHSIDARSGEPLGEPVSLTNAAELDDIVRAAANAFPAFSRRDDRTRAEVLDAIADTLETHADELVEIADSETALGPTRLAAEISRASGQFRLFADVLCDGAYREAILSRSEGSASLPDVRRMLRPLGPVAVFGASNFPFAFSVAGGDTASALAAGCPVIVKAHEGHLRTSMRCAELIKVALRAPRADESLLSVVVGVAAGKALVRHPLIRAVGFTGSQAGGRALFDLACSRPDPIPFYGELGSLNPVVVLPAAAEHRPVEIARGYAASLTLGVGQFCTNPGLLFVPQSTALLDALSDEVSKARGGTMLNARIAEAFEDAISSTSWMDLTLLARGEPGTPTRPEVRSVRLDEFVKDPERLGEERFGPAGLVVIYDDVESLHDALREVGGNLTATVHADAEDGSHAARLAEVLEPLVGRLVFNDWPTGVAVNWAMHHGGPWPATTASLHSSVGATAIRRWLTPIAYQNWPDELLPPQLQDANPLGIPRRHE